MNWNRLGRAGLRDVGAKKILAHKRRAKLRIYFEVTSHFIWRAKEKRQYNKGVFMNLDSWALQKYSFPHEFSMILKPWA